MSQAEYHLAAEKAYRENEGESVSNQAITQRMLYCSRCIYCSSQGATLDFMNNHLTNSRLCDPSFVAILPQYPLQATKVSDA